MRHSRGLIAIGLLSVVAALAAAWGEWQKQVRPQLIIEWSTESQVDTAGFFLYRGESPEGPWTQVNAALIPATDDVLTGGRYRYTDTAVLPAHTYYYQLEDIELGGQRDRQPIPGAGTPPAPRGWVLVLSGLGGLVGAYLALDGLGWIPRRRMPSPGQGAS
jgi:hypothetical protein